MLWVGGGIIRHGLESFHLLPQPGWAETLMARARATPAVGPALGWAIFALASAGVGLAVGTALLSLIRLWRLARRRAG